MLVVSIQKDDKKPRPPSPVKCSFDIEHKVFNKMMKDNMESVEFSAEGASYIQYPNGYLHTLNSRTLTIFKDGHIFITKELVDSRFVEPIDLVEKYNRVVVDEDDDRMKD